MWNAYFNLVVLHVSILLRILAFLATPDFDKAIIVTVLAGRQECVYCTRTPGAERQFTNANYQLHSAPCWILAIRFQGEKGRRKLSSRRIPRDHLHGRHQERSRGGKHYPDTDPCFHRRAFQKGETNLCKPLILQASPTSSQTVQIVVGAIEICFGVALTVAQEDSKTLTVKSGLYFWFGILLLISGSLLVEMEKRDLQWLVKASSAANLLVCVAALVAVILHSTEIAQTHQQGDLCDNSEMRYGYCFSSLQTLIYGLNAVFIIFSVLELCIAVAALVVGSRSAQQQLYRQMAS
ncbi:membrane-spanning 4-domains subfamily A member 15-like [Podarcis lilfordi]|uniref:Membrane-spanning 4-domains subfamily A member 15-like n=1 Tax=Podarcis lilfordi TaxID=74358 RepID=A0AA35JQQ9_9SAUR|nr:membrane-spanning 4-domains subfamily A member 15-like [Podarcis lilfordi]